jgi:acylpyruvate hydrolase
MQLATLKHPDLGSAAAVIVDNGAVVIPDAAGSPYPDVGAVLAAATGLDRARRAAAGQAGKVLPLNGLLRPVLNPGAVVCVGLNYRPHIVEMGLELPVSPTLFSKLPRAIANPGADIVLPDRGHKIDYEGELAVVIGKGGRDIEPGAAWDAVAGLTLFNDISFRDVQWRTTQWFAGKNFEGSSPLGPVMVTTDEILDLDAAQLIVRVNEEVRQSACIGELLFTVPDLIADISKIVELRPGDVIATGTPGGVGDAMDPPGYLRDGDVVEVELAPIGILRNKFRIE